MGSDYVVAAVSGRQRGLGPMYVVRQVDAGPMNDTVRVRWANLILVF